MEDGDVNENNYTLYDRISISSYYISNSYSYYSNGDMMDQGILYFDLYNTAMEAYNRLNKDGFKIGKLRYSNKKNAWCFEVSGHSSDIDPPIPSSEEFYTQWKLQQDKNIWNWKGNDNES